MKDAAGLLDDAGRLVAALTALGLEPILFAHPETGLRVDLLFDLPMAAHGAPVPEVDPDIEPELSWPLTVPSPGIELELL